MGRKTLYRADFHPEEAKRLAETGMTESEICKALAISVDTINQWKKRYPEFSEALTEGKREPNRKVEAALIKRALGMKVREVIYKPSKVEGKPATPIRIVERDVPPNQRSMEFWLSNRMKNRWKRRIAIDFTASAKRSTERDPEKLKVILENMRQVMPALVAAGKNGGNGHHA